MVSNINIYQSITIMLTSFIVSLLLISGGLPISKKIRLLDIPNSEPHKLHKEPMPLIGGFVLIVTLTLIMYIFQLNQYKALESVLIAGWVIFIFGLLDDFSSLTVAMKLLGQLFASILLVYLGVQIRFFSSPEFFLHTGTNLDSWLNIIFTISWLLVITNAFNFVDSMDGLAIGLVSVSVIFFFIITLVSSQIFLPQFCAAIFGITLGLYLFNSYPAKLFLGDSGAQTFGFVLGAVAIIYNPTIGNQSSSWFVPVLLFAVPLFDLSFVMVTRIRKGNPITRSSNDHTYHQLIALGFQKERSILLIHCISLVLCCIGYLCLKLSVIIANIIFVLILVGFVGLYFIVDRKYLTVDNRSKNV